MTKAGRSFAMLLLTAVVGAGFGYWAWQRSAVEAEGGEKAVASKLFDFSKDDVTALVIETEGNVTRLERADRGWNLVAPVKMGADEGSVRKVAHTLATLKAETRFGNGKNAEIPALDVTGLAEPTVVIKAETPAGEFRLETGSRNEFNREVYARAVGPGVEPSTVTISPSTFNALNTTWSTFIDRRSIGADTERVLKLKIHPAEVSETAIVFEIERQAPDPNRPRYQQEARFRVTEPAIGEADTTAVEQVLKSLARAPISEIVTENKGDDLKKWGLDEPDFLVTVSLLPLSLGKGAPELEERVLRVKAFDDSTAILTRDDQPWVAKANITLMSGLSQSKSSLESKRLLHFDHSLVTRVELEVEKAGHITAERWHPPGKDDPEWRLLAPEPAKAKGHRVAAIALVFSQLTGKTREVVGDAARDPARQKQYGLGDSAQRIRFFDDRGNELGALKIGRVEGNEVYAMAEGGDLIVRADSRVLEELPEKAADLVDAN